MILSYPIDIKESDLPNEGKSVTFPDFPRAAATASNKDEVLLDATHNLGVLLTCRVSYHADIPEPSAPDGRPTVVPSINVQAKVLLYIEMRRQDVTKAELARRMGVFRQEMTRLLNPGRPTKVENIERAFAALGKRLVVEIV